MTVSGRGRVPYQYMDFLERYQTLGTGAGGVKMNEEAGHAPHENETRTCHGDETRQYKWWRSRGYPDEMTVRKAVRRIR